MQRLPQWIAALILVGVTGCATVDHGAFVDRGADFNRYQSFAWTAADRRMPSDSRFQRDADFRDHLQGAIERALITKGLNGPVARRPDLLVRYRAAARPRVDQVSVDRNYGSCALNCSDFITEYEAATLVVDVIDARTSTVIWRGWAQDRLDAVPDTKDRTFDTLQKTVAAMMAAFPARPETRRTS